MKQNDKIVAISLAALAVCTLATFGAMRLSENRLGTVKTQEIALKALPTGIAAQDEALYITQQEAETICGKFADQMGIAPVEKLVITTQILQEKRVYTGYVYEKNTDKTNRDMALVCYVDGITGEVTRAISYKNHKNSSDWVWPVFVIADNVTASKKINTNHPNYGGYTTRLCDAASAVYKTVLNGKKIIAKKEYAPKLDGRDREIMPFSVLLTMEDGEKCLLTLNPVTLELYEYQSDAYLAQMETLY